MKPHLSPTVGLGREAVLLMAASGLFSLCFMGAHALLRVLYILRLGHGPEYVGLFSAAGALSFMATSLPAGALGERIGTRRVMLASGIVCLVGMGLLPMVESVPPGMRYMWPVLSQVVLIAGWAALNVNLVPALMGATTAGNRNQAYSANTAMRSLGTLVGSIGGGALPGLFAGLLGQTLAGPDPYRYALWTATGVGLAGLVPLLLLRDIRQPRVAGPVLAGDEFPLRPMAVLVAHVVLAHSGWATAQAFGNAYMDAELRLPASAIGLITGLAQFVAFLACLLTPRLAHRRGNGWVLIITTLGMGASLLPLALIPHWAAAGLGRVGVLALDAMWISALQVLQMEQVSARWRALAYGGISVAMGMSFASISLGGGHIIAAAGYRSVFLLGVALCVAGAGSYWLSRSRLPLLAVDGPPAPNS